MAFKDKFLAKSPFKSGLFSVLGLQRKWAGAHAAGSDANMPENPTPEQRAQKANEDRLYTLAQKEAQHGATTAGVSAQGSDYEKASKSKEYRDTLRKTSAWLEKRT